VPSTLSGTVANDRISIGEFAGLVRDLRRTQWQTRLAWRRWSKANREGQAGERPDETALITLERRVDVLVGAILKKPVGSAPVSVRPVTARRPEPVEQILLPTTGEFWRIDRADCLGFLDSLPENCASLTIGSPPYPEKGERYGTGKSWPTLEWVEWMIDVTHAARRITSGPVLWVVNGAVRDGVYRPACEGLIWEYWERHGGTERPCIWHKNAPPCKRNWFGNDWEFILAFGHAHHFDWQAIASPPKYTAGGQFRQRSANGERRLGSEYPQSKLARPRDVFRVPVGGGHLGSKLAHLNHAPFPEKLVEPFVRVLTKPGDVVCDPFSGSGTTAAVAKRLGRNFVGCDEEQGQVELALRRLGDVKCEVLGKT
jgi:DNA modification methylase